MNSFMKYDHGTLASAYFEHTRRTDAHFRKKVYDLRVAMYKTTYMKEFQYPEHILKSDSNQVEPRFVVIPKPTEEEFKRLYSPKIIHRQVADNKRIEPALEYSNDNQPKVGTAAVATEVSKDSEKYRKSLYQESYINRMPSRVNKKEETREEWVQRWKDECFNLRDADDLVQDLSYRVINSQQTILNRKRFGNII